MKTIIIVVEQLPEGVWLATSPDLPGLIVETATKEEAMRLAPKIARDLLSLKPPLEYGTGGTSASPMNLRVWSYYHDSGYVLTVGPWANTKDRGMVEEAWKRCRSGRQSCSE